MAFLWTKDLETGNALIDTEHKKLIQAADELVTACSQGKGRQEISRAVDFLSSYTKTHFGHEEELQVKHKYPDYPVHKNWHKEYVKAIENVAEKMKAEGATIALVAEVNVKVSELLTHIKTFDKKLAQYINTQK